MPKRGQGFTNDEIDHLLDHIEDVLPIGQIAWDRVLVLHETKFANRERTVQSLQRKFATLYNHNIPTGDPRCPETVRRAKRLNRLINEKMDVATGEEGGGGNDDDDDDDDSEGEEEDEEGGDEEGNNEGGNEGGEDESQLVDPVSETLEGQGTAGDNNSRGNSNAVPNDAVTTRPSSRASSHVSDGQSSRVSDGQSQNAVAPRTRQRTSDNDSTATKVRKTSAFSTPIVHSRRNKGNTPGSNNVSGSGSMFQEMMQMMMVQREIDSESERRRREAEDLRHRQMMDMFMMSMMTNNSQRNQLPYSAPPPPPTNFGQGVHGIAQHNSFEAQNMPPLNNYGGQVNSMPWSSFDTTGNVSSYTNRNAYNAPSMARNVAYDVTHVQTMDIEDVEASVEAETGVVHKEPSKK